MKMYNLCPRCVPLSLNTQNVKFVKACSSIDVPTLLPQTMGPNNLSRGTVPLSCRAAGPEYPEGGV